jgi:sugar phosphate isomerase/epimerase
VRERADELGLELLSLGLSPNFAVPDRARIDAEIERAERLVDAAAALGVPLLRLCGNGARGAPDPEAL